MICNVASDLATKQLCWTVVNRTTGRYIQCVPAHKVSSAMSQLAK